MLSTVGKVVLEKDVQGVWRGGLNWSVGRIRPAGRSLATPSLETNIPKNFKQQMLAICPGRCLFHHKRIQNECFPRHSG